MKKFGWIVLAVLVALLVVGTYAQSSPADRGTHVMQSIGFAVLVVALSVIGSIVWRRRRAPVRVRTDED